MTTRFSYLKVIVGNRSWVLLFFLFNLVNAIAQSIPFPTSYPVGTDTIFNKNSLLVVSRSKDTLEVSEFKNGYKNGRQTIYNRRGFVEITAEYTNGLLNGKATQYSGATQNIVRIEHYTADQHNRISRLHGNSIEYSPEGVELVKYTFKNGERNGSFITRYFNKQVKEKGQFKSNLLVGKKRAWSKTGQLISKEIYIIVIEKDKNGETRSNSVRHGKAVYYFPDGSTSVELEFVNGKKEGLCKEYYSQKGHLLKSEVMFKDGLEHGEMAYYNPNGSLNRKGKYYRKIKQGDTVLINVYDGKLVRYDANGKLQSIEHWGNFKKNGTQEYYGRPSYLRQRFSLKDNLKIGKEEQFDINGTLIYSAYFEIVEKDGIQISQQTGTESKWLGGKLILTREWKNGKKNGPAKSYYANGQLEKSMNFKNDKVHGKLLAYYENGQLKLETNYMYQEKGSNSKRSGWNVEYNKEGQMLNRFYALPNDKKLIEQKFNNGSVQYLGIKDALELKYTHTNQLNSIKWTNRVWPIFGYSMFINKELRRVNFQTNGYPTMNANFTDEGEVIQVNGIEMNHKDYKNAATAAEKIAQQYNPKWVNDPLTSDLELDGKYQLEYADGTTFIEIEFIENLPHGKWICHHPYSADTLYYAEYDSGEQVGYMFRRNLNGLPARSREWHPNKKLKVNRDYWNGGILQNISKLDSSGLITYKAEYYENGFPKLINNNTEGLSIRFSESGDTTYKSLNKDSVSISYNYYEGSKLKEIRIYNLLTKMNTITTYFESGLLKTYQENKERKPHGVFRMYTEQGQLLLVGKYLDGEKEGKWVNYGKDSTGAVSYFSKGERIQGSKDSADILANECLCLDKSLKTSKLGFPGLLEHLADYKAVKKNLPENVIPIDEWHYDKLFYSGYINNSSHSGRYSRMRLILFKEFSFHYPVVDYLKFTLNPCKTEGYVGDISININYDYEGDMIQSSSVETKRIAVGLEKNPLVNASDNGIFTAYFDTKEIWFDSKGINNIIFPNNKNECYPKGEINNFFSLEIDTAFLVYKPYMVSVKPDFPLLRNEINGFYGLQILASTITFGLDSTVISARSHSILAGSNYVAGMMVIPGIQEEAGSFKLEASGESVSVKKLQRVLEEQGFYRVKISMDDKQMVISFYTEK